MGNHLYAIFRDRAAEEAKFQIVLSKYILFPLWALLLLYSAVCKESVEWGLIFSISSSIIIIIHVSLEGLISMRASVTTFIINLTVRNGEHNYE